MAITSEHPNAVMFKKKEPPIEEAAMLASPHEPEKPHPPHPPEKPPQPKRPDEEPEPKPEPEHQPKEPPEATAPQAAAFTVADIERMMNKFDETMATAIREARKPIRDERAIARMQRMKEHNHQMQKDAREMLIARFRNCNHMQLPGSVMTGCSCIAWATQSDGIKRGTCQHCGTIFSSKREECLNQEVWESYKMLVRMPTHPAGNFNTIFQSA